MSMMNGQFLSLMLKNRVLCTHTAQVTKLTLLFMKAISKMSKISAKSTLPMPHLTNSTIQTILHMISESLVSSLTSPFWSVSLMIPVLILIPDNHGQRKSIREIFINLDLISSSPTMNTTTSIYSLAMMSQKLTSSVENHSLILNSMNGGSVQLY